MLELSIELTILSTSLQMGEFLASKEPPSPMQPTDCHISATGTSVTTQPINYITNKATIYAKYGNGREQLHDLVMCTAQVRHVNMHTTRLTDSICRVPTVLVKKISRTFPGPQKHFSRTNHMPVPIITQVRSL